ncbi:hypothetical protein Tco_0450839 [Tanacetum coccineum]
MYSCELCRNDAHYGYDYPPQVPLVYEPEPEKLSQALQALCEKLNKNVQEKQEEKNVVEEQAAKVMDISVISVSSDPSKESVGTSTGRVILFGTIPTTITNTTLSVIPPTTHIDTTPIPIVSPTIPPSPNYTPASPNYSPASDTEFDPSEDPSSDHIPPLPATLPFLSLTDDSSDSDTPYTPPSPTHGTPFTETTLSTQRSPVAYGAL